MSLAKSEITVVVPIYYTVVVGISNVPVSTLTPLKGSIHASYITHRLTENRVKWKVCESRFIAR